MKIISKYNLLLHLSQVKILSLNQSLKFTVEFTPSQTISAIIEEKLS